MKKKPDQFLTCSGSLFNFRLGVFQQTCSYGNGNACLKGEENNEYNRKGI